MWSDAIVARIRDGIASRRGALRKARAAARKYPHHRIWICEREVGRYAWRAFGIESFVNHIAKEEE